MGIYADSELACGCRVRKYTGGIEIHSGCEKHVSSKQFVCPSCSIKFESKAELKNNRWIHAV